MWRGSSFTGAGKRCRLIQPSLKAVGDDRGGHLAWTLPPLPGYVSECPRPSSAASTLGARGGRSRRTKAETKRKAQGGSSLSIPASHSLSFFIY